MLICFERKFKQKHTSSLCEVRCSNRTTVDFRIKAGVEPSSVIVVVYIWPNTIKWSILTQAEFKQRALYKIGCEIIFQNGCILRSRCGCFQNCILPYEYFSLIFQCMQYIIIFADVRLLTAGCLICITILNLHLWWCIYVLYWNEARISTANNLRCPTDNTL